MERRIFLSRRGRLKPYGKGVNEDEKEHRVFPGRRRRHGRRRGGGDDGPPEQPPGGEEAGGSERPQAGHGGGAGGGQRRLQHGLTALPLKKSPESTLRGFFAEYGGRGYFLLSATATATATVAPTMGLLPMPDGGCLPLYSL